MTPLDIGLLVAAATLLVLATGVPIAFGLGFVALVFLALFEGPDSIGFAAEIFFSGLSDFTLIAIPMFIVMGTAIASSPAAADLYAAIERWLGRLPGGLAISNIGACTLFSALSGSSPATCAAIGKMGIPEMRARGYPDGLATGAIAAGGTLGILIPPSVTMIVYGIATGTSIGRLFVAGLLPGVMLAGLFMLWAGFASRRGRQAAAHARADAAGAHARADAAGVLERRYSFREKIELMPRVLPFMVVIAGILYVLYGGLATPSEAAGVGAVLCLVLVAVAYRRWRPRQVYRVFADSMRESVMIMMIIAASALFSYMLSTLFVTQSVAELIVGLDANRWVVLAIINVFLLVAGFFLPPVAVIVMTAPILLPIVEGAGFDPYWFAVVMTINMEIGLITPPVGLNLYVINGIAPDVPLERVLTGTLPFVLMMVVGIALLAVFPGIATWLPSVLMG